MLDFLGITKKSACNYSVATIVGVIGGIMSAFVKSGTEGILPPRTPSRMEPPVELLEEVGIHAQNMVYFYSEHIVNWAGSTVHILFSIIFATIYCVLAEKFPKIKLWQGVAYGLVIAVLFHGIILPLFGLSPFVWMIPYDEIISELIGTIFWVWTIETFRRDLRNHITKKPDPEFQ